MREIILSIASDWMFENNPYYFIFASHTLKENINMKCVLRSGSGLIEYNPTLRVSKDCLNKLLETEILRLLFKHPYQRKPDPFFSELALFSSSAALSIDENLSLEFQNKSYEEIYYSLLRNEELRKEIMNKKQGVPNDKTLQQKTSDEKTNAESKKEKSKDDFSGSFTEQDSGTSNTDCESLAQKECKSTNDGINSESDSTISGSNGRSSNDSLSATGLWGIQDIEQETHMDDILKNVIKQITDSIPSQNYGVISEQLTEIIIAKSKKSENLKKTLKLFRDGCIRKDFHLTRMRPSRRYGYDGYGRIKDSHPYFLLCIDCSGSITNKQLVKMLSAIKGTFKNEEMSYIYFDTQIIGKPKKIKNIKDTTEICGRGGTDFQCIFDFCKLHQEYDGVMIFTDGYSSEPKCLGCKQKFAWICTSHNEYLEHYEWMKNTGIICYLEE